jgi:hypothetical protein
VSIPYSLRMIRVAFHNVVVSTLFNRLRMWSFAYFVILINKFIYKRVGSDVSQRTRE